MSDIYDIATFDGTIANNDSETLTVSTNDPGATALILLADNGNQDGQPSQYTVTVRLLVTQVGTTPVFLDSITNVQKRQLMLPAVAPEMQVIVKNTSGSGATYRLTLLAVSGDIASLVQEGNSTTQLTVVDEDGGSTDLVSEALNEGVSSGAQGLITYSAGALQAVATDEIRMRAQEHAAFFTDIQLPAGNISGGVTASPASKDERTLYLNVAGAIDVTVELSPDNGSNYYEIDESPFQFTGSGDQVTHFDYDFSSIRLTGSNSTNVQAQMHETM